MESSKIAALVDRAEIGDVLGAIFRGADARNWNLCRSAFADVVHLDYGTPENIAADAIMERWRALFALLDMTQHVVSNHAYSIAGDTAFVASEFIATHRSAGAPGGDLWTLGGAYEFELRRTAQGWRVTRMKMTPKWSLGNAALIEQARAKHP